MLYKKIKKKLNGRFLKKQLDTCVVCKKHIDTIACLCQNCLYEVCPDCMHDGIFCKKCFLSMTKGFKISSSDESPQGKRMVEFFQKYLDENPDIIEDAMNELGKQSAYLPFELENYNKGE